MILINLSDTEVRKRQRTDIDGTKLHELKEKIAKQGLLHPPVFWQDPHTKKWVLNAGERRFRAIQALHNEKRELRCNSVTVPVGQVPITLLDERLDEISRFETELDENIIREELSWQDRVRAYADLHILRKASNPKQTLLETGQEIAQRQGAASDRAGEFAASQAVLLAPISRHA